MALRPGNRNNDGQIYDLDYFSSSQAHIFIGNTWVEEVTGLTWRVTQTKKPVYGYASQLFDAVSAGTVLVEGAFSINYIASGYLFMILNRARTAAGTPFPRGGFMEAKFGKDPDEQLKLDLAGVKPEALSIFLSDTFATHKPEDRAQLEGFTKAFWGTPSNRTSSDTRRADDNQFDNINIRMLFGDPEASNFTARNIIGVHLLSTEQSIEIGSGALQETYSFLAKDIASF